MSVYKDILTTKGLDVSHCPPCAIRRLHVLPGVTYKTMVYPSGLVECCPAQLSSRHQLMHDYAVANNYGTPTLDTWFLGSEFVPLHQSPFPDSERLFYPGIIRLGVHKDYRPIKLFRLFEERQGLPAVGRYVLMQNGGIVLPQSLVLDNFQFDDWTHLILPSDSYIRRGTETWLARIDYMSCIGLLLDGSYDGPLIDSGRSSKYRTERYATLFKVVHDHLQVRANKSFLAQPRESLPSSPLNVSDKKRMFTLDVKADSQHNKRIRTGSIDNPVTCEQPEDDRMFSCYLEFHSQLKALSDENSKLKFEVQNVKAQRDMEIDGLKKQLVEKEENEAQLKDLSDENSELKSEVKDVKAQREMDHQKIDELEKQLAEKEENEAQLKSRKIALSTELDATKQSNDDLVKKCADAENTISNHTAHAQGLERDIAELLEKKEAHDAALQNAQGRLSAAEDKYRRYGEAITMLQWKFDEYKGDNDKVVRVLEEEKEQLAKDKQSLTTKYEGSLRSIASQKNAIVLLESEAKHRRLHRIKLAKTVCPDKKLFWRDWFKRDEGLNENQATERAERIYYNYFERDLEKPASVLLRINTDTAEERLD
ncbi:hypothetical protein OPT61_g1778 [Boeremia exigua]|uniref:Uncharacterized protein n=1 Tax=Boeremia exigua TaxID=749465 RepID=A0ACC2INU5_9PLEO|nr:hypothetical protein OPT61_g1778 [Boeremia exigua]